MRNIEEKTGSEDLDPRDIQGWAVMLATVGFYFLMAWIGGDA